MRALGLAALALAALSAPASASKSVRAVAATVAPTIDGTLDEAVWRSAPWVHDFAQSDPYEGAPPSRRTEVAFAYDADALYVGARMYADGPGDIEAVMTRRDDSGRAERIIVSFDTFSNRRTAYSFAVTAAGVRVDWFHPDDNAFNRDASFDPVWQARVRVHEAGWTAEMRIPFSQLRFPDRADQIWGVNINRYMPQNREDVFWTVVPKNEVGWSSYFGELRGIQTPSSPRRLELLPYIAGDATLESAATFDADDPFADRLELDLRAGADLKLGLGSSLTLDATINPDFGQVEADPAVVNLSAFEPIFDERRPFFTEGSELLAGNGPRYFYSRRIGAPPRGDPAADPRADLDGDGASDIDYARADDFTRILGAAKVTGRLGRATSMGALAAITAPADADVALGAMRLRVPVEPTATYGVLRVQHELGRDASLVGASLTHVHRFMAPGAPLADQLASSAVAGGADWRLRFADAAWELRGFAGGSVVSGEPTAIERLQRASAHYFQRPDQGHVRLDPDQTTMAGWTAQLAGQKRKGRWIGGAQLGAESPGFEPNDVGLLQSADDIWVAGDLRYRQNLPGRRLHRWELGGQVVQEWNFGGVRKPGAATLDGSLTWAGTLWRTNAAATLLTPGDSDDLTRGGPLSRLGPGWQLSLGQSSGQGGRTSWEVSGQVFGRETGDSGVRASVSTTWLPLDRLALTVTPRFEDTQDTRQFIAAIGDAGGGGDTYGVRYVFGTLDRRELAVQLRANLAFTPTLSLETYVEPFASSGRFSRFGELARAGGEALRRYGDDGTAIAPIDGGYSVTDGADQFELAVEDFTVVSLRSTAVLRWEFAPGSSVFAVWQQSRLEDLGAGRGLAGVAELGDAVTAPGISTLALKISYWWGAH